MCAVGSPLHTSLVQAAQARQAAAGTRERERVESARTRRCDDRVERRVSGVESADAARNLPRSDSGQAGVEHRERHIDVVG